MKSLSVSSEILVYAARYALGRRSGAAQDVAAAIGANARLLRGTTAAHVLIGEIESYERSLGDMCDVDSWQRTLLLLRGEP